MESKRYSTWNNMALMPLLLLGLIGIVASADLSRLPGASIPIGQEDTGSLYPRDPVVPMPEISALEMGPLFEWQAGLTLTRKGVHFGTISAQNASSVTRKVCVNVAQAPVDVYFLADTTGSMGSHINSVKSAANSIFASLSASLTNLRIGVGAYRDFGDAYVFNHIQSISGTLTASSFGTQVNQWVAGGGGDWPEAQLYALQQVASLSTIGWRTNSIKMIVWFGDAPGHDPSGGVSLAAALTALQAKSIKVIALDNAYLNYANPSQQATYLASSTGGQYHSSVSPANISATIVNSILNQPITVIPTFTCQANVPFTFHFSPPNLTITPGKPGCFNITLKMCEDLDCKDRLKYTCTIIFRDAVSNAQIGSPVTVTTTVTGTDTTPPTFVPNITPVNIYAECPRKYDFPVLSAVDDCGKARVVTRQRSKLGGCPANVTVSQTWIATDSSGNSATMSQTITYGDSTPPYLTAECQNKHVCLAQTTDATSTICIPMDTMRSCFTDDCSRITKFSVECGNCTRYGTNTTYPGGPVNIQCKPKTEVDDSGLALPTELCFTVSGMPHSEEPVCCEGLATVADECGNVAQIPYPKVCVYNPRTLPSDQDCLRLEPAVGVKEDSSTTTTTTTVTGPNRLRRAF